MLVTGDWSPAVAKIAKRFQVCGLDVSVKPPANRSLDFLSNLPNLQSLEISSFWLTSGRSLVDWKKIEMLSDLENLSISCYEPEGEPCEIDFRKLSRLKACNITWRGTWSSILKAGSLRKLRIRDQQNKLVELDCTSLRGLKELQLDPCFALKIVALAESARVSELSLGGTPKFKPDWKRLGRDLERLNINGKVGFALEELRVARKLRRFSLFNMRKVASLQFLRDLPAFEIIDSWNNKLSDADNGLVVEIIERFKKNKSKRR